MTENENPQGARPLRGLVKWFDPVKGFGFVLPAEGGSDILLHANVLRNFGQSSVADGAEVEIIVQETERGLQAVEVISLTPPASFGALGSELPDGDSFDELSDLDFQPARVKWFDKGKGFGFANVFGSSEDVFIHIEVLRRSGHADLQPGEAICLAIQDGKRGRMAVLVKAWDSMVSSNDE